MTNDKVREKIPENITAIEGFINQISISSFKSNIPRINFKKIRFNKFQSLCNSLLNFPVVSLESFPKVTEREEKQTLGTENFESLSPLRKRKIDDDIPPVINEQPIENNFENIFTENSQSEKQEFILFDNIEEEPKQEEDISNEFSLRKTQQTAEEAIKKDVTFNLEAEVLQEQDNVLLSPVVPATTLPEEEKIISTSGEQDLFVWPPQEMKKSSGKQKKKRNSLQRKVKKLKQKTKSKKKPYYLELQKSIGEEKVIKTGDLPWALEGAKPETREKQSLGSTLESELLDIPTSEESKTEEKIEIKEEFEDKSLIYKAFSPNIEFNEFPDITIDEKFYLKKDLNNVLDKFTKLEFGINNFRKAGKMFERFGYTKLTPIRIIILGGAIATLGYSAWNYILPIINNPDFSGKTSKVVVKNLFKSKHLTKKEEVLVKTEALLNEDSFKPISEEERFSLIQKAKDSIGGRDNPFGQEEVLPREVIEQRAQEQEAEKTPPEIPINRKQLELVGVISANNKDLALVNVYNADFTVLPDDNKEAREGKLKTSLSMAVPNRLEVSILDPIEEWYIKQIVKGKIRGDDPFVELVKGDKKFKLKIGQKLLLPEEKSQEETAKEEGKVENNNKDAGKKEDF